MDQKLNIGKKLGPSRTFFFFEAEASRTWRFERWQTMSAEVSRREAEAREPRVEIGVAERAFSSEEAPLADAILAVGVVADREHCRGPAMEGFQANWTRLPSDRRRNYSPEELRFSRR